MTVHIRWMIRRDMPEVLAIENGSFVHRWKEEDFIAALQSRKCIGMVAEFEDAIGGDKIIGFMLYELEKAELRLLNFAVDPEWRRCGVGAAMVEKMVSKLSPQRRKSISLAVRESNLDAQLFFRAMGFEAVNVCRGFYDDTGEDAYRFVYLIGSESAVEEAMA